MIPLAEWLHLAKQCAVGQSKRVKHKQEATAAMTVRNLPDRYTAYCHRCHEGAVHLKEHAALTPIETQDQFMPWPDDAVLFEHVKDWELLKIWEFLISKGIDYNAMLKHVQIYYSSKHGRLIFETDQGWIGRALRGQAPKWCTYGSAYAVYGLGAGELIQPRVVLTEDYLSKLKGSWAVPNVTWIAALGTKVHTKLVAKLLQSNVQEVGIMFDGDKAGIKGHQPAIQRLQGLGIHAFAINTPPGCDPKDLRRGALLQLIREAPWTLVKLNL